MTEVAEAVEWNSAGPDNGIAGPPVLQTLSISQDSQLEEARSGGELAKGVLASSKTGQETRAHRYGVSASWPTVTRRGASAAGCTAHASRLSRWAASSC